MRLKNYPKVKWLPCSTKDYFTMWVKWNNSPGLIDIKLNKNIDEMSYLKSKGIPVLKSKYLERKKERLHFFNPVE